LPHSRRSHRRPHRPRRSTCRSSSLATRPRSPAPSHGPVPVRLVANADALALTAEPAPISSAPTGPEPASTPAQRIEAALADLETAATLDDLRRACRMRTQSLCDALADLVRAGKVVKSEAGYRLA
jgi:hypothetical protein